MVTFIDQHRATYGVEPICRVVPIAPFTDFRWKVAQADPTKRSARAIRDEVLKAIILRSWHEHQQVCGAHKVWKQMGREGLHEARCRVRRRMKALSRRRRTGRIQDLAAFGTIGRLTPVTFDKGLRSKTTSAVLLGLHRQTESAEHRESSDCGARSRRRVDEPVTRRIDLT